ncbi:MAG: general secretion pathway protein GspK [Candidatus Eremiobacteraeota bacterium]|nr:general secretion pathway protein GspK [Candidatus Eremiobacteraeota bacterium]
MVILVVLGMLLIALSFSTQLANVASELDRQQRILAGRETNYMVARSAFELALQLVQADDNDTDGPGDLWATGPQQLDWEGHNLRVEVQDEERRLPLSGLVTEPPEGGQPADPSPEQLAMRAALERFLDRAGQPSQRATAALIDWIDSDSQPQPGGTERGELDGFQIKNAPIDSLYELRYIAGWGNPSLPRPRPLASAGTGEVEGVDVPTEEGLQTGNSNWSDWLTPYSEGKVNINTAPEEILLALDGDMTDALVSEIITKRQEKALASEQDLQEITGINPDLAFRLNRLVTYKSRHFRIRIVVDDQPGRIRLEAVVRRDQQNPRVLSWEVN